MLIYFQIVKKEEEKKRKFPTSRYAICLYVYIEIISKFEFYV